MNKAEEKFKAISGSEHRYNTEVLKAHKLLLKQELVSEMFYGCTIEDISGKVLFAEKLFHNEIPGWLDSKMEYFTNKPFDSAINKIVYRQLIIGKLSEYLSPELSGKLAREIIEFGEEHELLKDE